MENNIKNELEKIISKAKELAEACIDFGCDGGDGTLSHCGKKYMVKFSCEELKNDETNSEADDDE